MRTKPLSHLFWDKVDKSGDCWIWTGVVQHRGYGQYGSSKVGSRQAHRIAYEDRYGPIPDGLVIDHVCHNQDLSCDLNKECLHRRCVNPDHLEAVSFQENVARGRTANKTHCKRGHEFTAENTYVHTDKRGYTSRNCRICLRDAARRQSERRKMLKASV